MPETARSSLLETTWDAHVAAEFAEHDADAAVATMTDDAVLVHVPMSTGARGRAAIRRFYAEQFIPAWPDDVSVQSLSRTVGTTRVVDELLVRCTHSRPMPFWLPGVAPTRRSIELLHVAVVAFDDAGRIASEHIYWDQASLLVQVGLLDPAGLPALGMVQARALLDPSAPLDDGTGERPVTD
jgi:carboxymethylenebutenolidase